MINVLLNKITPDTKIIGGWAGDQLDKFGGWTDEQLQKLGNAITTGIYNGFIAIMDTICDLIYWVSTIGIICCIIIYFASRDKKAVSTGWKLILAYFITAVVISKL